MRKQLSHAGYVVLDARDGASALHVARTSKPDVITLDLMMPGLDGWTFIDKLRQEEGLGGDSDGRRLRSGRGRTPGGCPPTSPWWQRAKGRSACSAKWAWRWPAAAAPPSGRRRRRRPARGADHVADRGGHRVLQARDGAEALAAIEREHGRLDGARLWMPNVDGFEVLERMKEPGRVAIPVWS